MLIIGIVCANISGLLTALGVVAWIANGQIKSAILSLLTGLALEIAAVMVLERGGRQ